MELKNSILEKITNLYGLLSKIDKYWTKAEVTKSIKKYNNMESTAEQDLDYLLEDKKN